MHWRMKWQPALVFLPGESQGQRSLVGCHLWGLTESDGSDLAVAAAENCVAEMVKNLPAMKETHDRSLGQEDPVELGMATHSSVLAWKIPWTKEPGELQSIGLQRVRHA